MKILITGGSRGIGKAIAQELAKDHHDLLLVARNPVSLKHTAKDLRASTSGAIDYFACDVSQPDNLLQLHDYCIQNGFFPNVLVLCAGIFIEGSLTTSPPTDFARTMETNFFSLYHCVRLFIEELKQQSYARIVLIGSTAAYEAYPIGPLYGVAKWALRGYAINLRQELMKNQIGVTFLAPGGTLTDLWAGEELPENRLLDPRDIGKLVRASLLLSNQAVVEELIVRPMLGDIHDEQH